MKTRNVISLLVTGAISLTACGSSGSAPVAGDLPACPSSWAGATNAVLLWGDSASQRSDAITSQRLEAVRDHMRTAAACNTDVTVRWVPGQTAATTMFSGSVHKDGATEKIVARLSNKEIDEVAMPVIQAAVAKQTATPPNVASSPAGLFNVIADDRGVRSGHLVVTILDDFVAETTQVNLNTPNLSLAAVQTAANSTAVPTLGETTVSIQGVGITTDTTPAPDDWVASLRAYADLLCQQTTASCQPATTQYVGSGV